MANSKWYSLTFIGGSSKCVDIAPALGIEVDSLNPGDVVAASLKVLTCPECNNTRYSIDVQGVLKAGTPAVKALGVLPVLVVEGTHSAKSGENQYNLMTWNGRAIVVAGVGMEYVIVRDVPEIPGGEVYYEGVTLSGILIPYPSGSKEEEDSKLLVREGQCLCPRCKKKDRIENYILSYDGRKLTDVLGFENEEDIKEHFSSYGSFSVTVGGRLTSEWKYGCSVTQDEDGKFKHFFMDYQVPRYKEPVQEVFETMDGLVERIKNYE